jgi:hypothetical protein
MKALATASLPPMRHIPMSAHRSLWALRVASRPKIQGTDRRDMLHSYLEVFSMVIESLEGQGPTVP